MVLAWFNSNPFVLSKSLANVRYNQEKVEEGKKAAWDSRAVTWCPRSWAIWIYA